MKRILLSLAGIVLLLPALVQCSKEYDDAWIKSKFDQIDSKLSNLESSINSLNSYKTIIDNLKNGKVIDRIVDNKDGTFSIYYVGDSTPVKIQTIKGDKGDKGDTGGKGDKGDKGDPGSAGTPGDDGVTPDFKIEDGDWYVSYDKGTTWTKIGSASSSESLFFKNVYVEGNHLVLVLIDGTEVRISLNGGEEQTADYADWLGGWSVRGMFDVEIAEKDGRPFLVFGGEDFVPLTWDAENKKMLLEMPGNAVFESGDLADWVMLYNLSNKSVSVNEGTLLSTLSLSGDKNTITLAAADATYNYIYIRTYDYAQSKYVNNKHYLYLNNETFTRKEQGGGETTGVPTKADWAGNWNKEGASSTTTICFYEASGYFMCYAPTSNFNDLGIVFDFNEEDGTWSFSVYDDGNGYAGSRTVDGTAEYFYFYAQNVDESGTQSYVSLTKGALLLKGTMSADKKTITITSGIENCNKVPLYNQTIKKWCTLPANWLGTYTKAE